MTAVEPGSPASDVGLQQGDIVTAVDGEAVASMPELAGRILAHRPGDEIELTIVRQGGERDLTVTLGTQPGSLSRGG